MMLMVNFKNQQLKIPQKPLKPTRNNEKPTNILRTNQKSWQTITSKDIVNDGQIQIIASEAIETFVQNILGSHRFEKKTIAIASAQKFDHRSSLFGAIQFMRKICKNGVQGFLSNICVLLCLSARKSKKTNIAIKWSMN